jgi:1-deoxy-D-xylulose-5-phosphate reductoisomerase
MEKIVLLGATGSIGSSVLDVIRSYPSKFKLIAVSCYKNIKKLEAIIKEFSPEIVCLSEENREFTAMFPEVTFVFNEEGLRQVSSLAHADTVIIGIAGISGLLPTLSAISSRKRILSANKESIVAAGPLLVKTLSDTGNFIIPLDSEHNAIFNIYSRIKRNFIKNICLTASGGPFLKKKITARTRAKEVMKHPVWEMGPSITVNSATMVNKGFEVIEAHFLFSMDYDSIKVLIHPQSLVHGIVETIDGTHFLAASPSDMRYPISLGMFYPDVPEQKFPSLELSGKNLEFFDPDYNKFPLLKSAYDAGKEGGIIPTVLNAANDTAASAFLKGEIKFIDIPVIVRRVIDCFIKRNLNDSELSLEIIRKTDFEARKAASVLIEKS